MLDIVNNNAEVLIGFDNGSKFNSLLNAVGEEYMYYERPFIGRKYIPNINFSISHEGKYKLYGSAIINYRSKECIATCGTNKCSISDCYRHRKTNFDMDAKVTILNEDDYTLDYVYRHKINHKFGGIGLPLKIKF